MKTDEQLIEIWRSKEQAEKNLDYPKLIRFESLTGEEKARIFDLLIQRRIVA